MRLMNVDQANSSVLARQKAYKIPIYTDLQRRDALWQIGNAQCTQGTLTQN